MEPISPAELMKHRQKQIPNEVIKCFNDMIIQSWSGNCAEFEQSDVVECILKAMPGLSRQDIFDKGYLDVEPLFEDKGWEVYYHKGFLDQPSVFRFYQK